MAKKLPVGQVLVGAAVGVGAYLAGVQLVKSSTWAAAHWYAVPGVALVGGLLVAKKHPAIGLPLAGAAGALGYFQYAAASGQQTQSTAQTTSTVQQPTTPPAQASTTPTGGSMQNATASNQANQDQTASQIGNVAQNLLGQATGAGQNADGSTNAASDGTTSGYAAGWLGGGHRLRAGSGALYGATPIQRHSQQGAGGFLDAA